MPAEDKSVTGFIQSMGTSKTAIEVDIIKQVLELAQSKPRDSTSEIIDLIFAVTGYGKAATPGGEIHVAAACISTLIRYMVLRANEAIDSKNTNEIQDTLLDLINKSVKLYGEVQVNKGVKIVERRA